MRWVGRLLAVLGPIGLTAAQAAGPALSPALSFDEARLRGRVTADRQGNIILAAQSDDCSLPVVNPISTCGWLWIAKLDPTGSTILFATYLGPPKSPAIVVSVQPDGAGNITVVSYGADSSLPAIHAMQPQPNGNYDAHIFKLAADGSRVLYATYLGGSGFDLPTSLALDGKGAAYILVESNSKDFPTTPQSLASTATNKWTIAKLSPDGQALEYAASVPMVNFETPVLQVDAFGAASFITGGEVLRLAPDGSALARRPLPAWVKMNPLLVPSGGGGFWLAGTEKNEALPVTPDAFQPARNPIPYVRVEDGQTLLPAAPMMAQQVSGFAVDPFETWRIYAATDGGLFQSEDNGWSWAILFAMPCVSVAVDPFDQNTLYVTASPGGFYRSTDRGQNWAYLAAPIIGSLATDPKVQGLIYAPGYRSADGGTTWQPYTIPQPVNGPCGSSCLYSSPVHVWTDPAQTGRIYVLIQTRCTGFCPIVYSFLRSDDGGRTFASFAGAFGNDLAVDSGSDDLFILGGGKVTVYRNSRPDAAEVLGVPEVSSIAVDPSHPGTVCLGLSGGSIIRSDDGGRSWSTVATLPAPASLLTVSIGGVLHASQPPALAEAFAFRFDGAGNIVYGTYFGGWNTTATAAAIGPNGHLFLGGNTGSGLPVSNAPQTQFAGGTDGFVAEFDANGTLLRSTYLGGAGNDQVSSLIPQDDGSVIVTGTSLSNDFLSQLQPSPIGGGNLFLVRLRP